jgi:hypothetical protein
MNELKRPLIIFAVLVSSISLAALPPQYQRLAELKAVLEHGAVIGAFLDQSHLVEGIELVEADVYRVTGGNCVLIARIVDLPQQGPLMVGARQFEVQVEPISCS